MKNIYLIGLLFVLVFCHSCQKEEIDVTDPNNEQEYLVPNSVLANLMLGMSLKDGSHDNAVDSTSALSVNFPIDVVLNGGQELTIFSSEAIEAHMQTYQDEFEIVFPITATTATYETIVFENQNQLDSYADTVDTADDIECIDFTYPFSLSIYNTQTEAFETFVIESDAALYTFIMNLTVEMLVSFDYPIQLTLTDGTEITINTNQELEDAILAAMDGCDEDDDPYNQNMLEPTLLNCGGMLDAEENPVYFYFVEGGIMEVVVNNQAYGGSWSMNIGNQDILSLEIEEAELWFEGEWTITGFSATSTGYVMEIENGMGEFALSSNCNLQPECSTTITECEIGTEVGYAGFVLAENDSCMVQLAGMEEGMATVSYHLSLPDAQNGTAAIVSTQQFVNTVQFSQYIYVRVENIETGIYEIIVILLVTEDC